MTFFWNKHCKSLNWTSQDVRHFEQRNYQGESQKRLWLINIWYTTVCQGINQRRLGCVVSYWISLVYLKILFLRMVSQGDSEGRKELEQASLLNSLPWATIEKGNKGFHGLFYYFHHENKFNSFNFIVHVPKQVFIYFIV